MFPDPWKLLTFYMWFYEHVNYELAVVNDKIIKCNDPNKVRELANIAVDLLEASISTYRYIRRLSDILGLNCLIECARKYAPQYLPQLYDLLRTK